MNLKVFIRGLGIQVLVGFCFLLSAGRLGADDFAATTGIVGRSTNGFRTPANQVVTPAGTVIELPGMRPQGLALSPDRKLLVTAGLTHELVVLDPATGRILQHVPLPADQTPARAPVAAQVLSPAKESQMSFTGLAFSPDGSRIYMANVDGDIKVFGVQADRTVVPLFSFPLPPANAPLRVAEIPAGLAVSPDGKRIYVAFNLSNRLAELDTATGYVLWMWDVGVAPYDVALAGRKIYVSNWGGRRPDAGSLTGPAGRGTLVRVDARSIASEGSVSVIDLDPKPDRPSPVSEILTGRHAGALALSPDRRWLVVANTSDDNLSVIDTRTDEIVETICARHKSRRPVWRAAERAGLRQIGQNPVRLQRHAKCRCRFSIPARPIQLAGPDTRRLVSRRDRL